MKNFSGKKYILKSRFYKCLGNTCYFLGNYNRALAYYKKVADSYFNTKFDVFSSPELEKTILKTAEKMFKKTGNKLQFKARNSQNPDIGILASNIYDSGGHTECVLRFVESFYQEYPMTLFLSNFYGDTESLALKKIGYVKDRIQIKQADYKKDSIDQNQE